MRSPTLAFMVLPSLESIGHPWPRWHKGFLEEPLIVGFPLRGAPKAGSHRGISAPRRVEGSYCPWTMGDNDARRRASVEREAKLVAPPTFLLPDLDGLV